MHQQAADQYLCDCLSDSPEAETRRGEPLSPSDWSLVARQAILYDLAPSLYKRLKATRPTPAPPPVLQLLQDNYLHTSGRNARMYRQLASILQELQRNAIPVIALKGAHLAEMVYGDAALRPMHDLDLLVKESDLLRVEAILAGIGYKRLYLPETQGEDEHFHFCYTPAQAPDRPVEIHWHLQRPDASTRLDIAELWARALPVTLAGAPALVLCPEDLLVYLCLHAAQVHAFEDQLKACYDIAQTIRRYRDTLDWRCVQAYAQRWHACKYVYLALRLAQDLMAAGVPDDVLAVLQPRDLDDSVIVQATAQLFNHTPSEQAALPLVSANHAQFWQAGRFQDRLAILCKSVFPPRLTLAKRYALGLSSGRLYFYYLVNLKDMLVDHGPAAWRLLRGDQPVTALAEEKATLAQQKKALEDWLANGSA